MLKSNQKPLPTKITNQYADVKPLSVTGYCKVYEGACRTTKEKFHIKILDKESQFYKADPSIAATMFIQELLRLCSIHPSAVRIEDFSYDEQVIGYVTRKSSLLSESRKEPLNSEKLVSDLISELSFVHTKLKTPDRISFKAENIHHIENSNCYFLSNWPGILQGPAPESPQIEEEEKKDESTALFSTASADELYDIGMTVLKAQSDFSSEMVDRLAIEEHEAVRNKLVLDLLSQMHGSVPLKVLLSFMMDNDKKRRLALVQFLAKKIEQENVLKIDGELIKSLKEFQEASVNRFKEIGYWDDLHYFPDELITDCISFSTSRSILIVGVGIYRPKGQNKLEGSVEIVNANSISERSLAKIDVSIDSQSGEICKVKLNKPVLIEAGTNYSIVTKLKGKDSHCGVLGQSTVGWFQFRSCSGIGVRSFVEKGQIPEIYYVELSLDTYHFLISLE